VNHLSGMELEGAYRRLCASMLAQSAFLLSERSLRPARSKQGAYYRSEMKRQRKAATEWIDGGDAVLPFAEACETLGMEEDYVRRGMERFIAKPDPNLTRRWRNAGVVTRGAIKD
jgi:hypothetical protein